MLSEDQKRILGYFIEEAKDHLNTIEQGLLNLQTTIEDAEMVNEVFRAAHSVKGGAAMLGLNSIQRTSHRLEDFFKLMKETPPQADRELESKLLRIFDGLQEQLEQLQGPYGLSDEQAQEIVDGLEPVFAETERHLQSLLEQVPAASKAQATPAPARATTPTAPAHPETSALQLVFQSDVPAQLRDMLTTFKQSDTAASRQELGQMCQRLKNIGVQFELAPWSQLVDLTSRAVANTQQSFRALAPVIIKSLKQAQDLVLAGQAEQIAAAPDLLALVPPESTSEETDDYALDTTMLAEALDNPEEATDDTDLAELLATAESGDTTTDLDDDSWLDEDVTAASDVDALEAAFDSLTAEVLDANATASGGPPTGVEVGDAELNSLADLFEGDGAGLEAVWEEEDLPESSPESDVDPGDSLDFDSDLADLLETATVSDLSEDDEDDDFVSLFGSSLEETPDSPGGPGELADSELSSPDDSPRSPAQGQDSGLDDFFAVPAEHQNGTHGSAAKDSDIDTFFEAPSSPAPAATAAEETAQLSPGSESTPADLTAQVDLSPSSALSSPDAPVTTETDSATTDAEDFDALFEADPSVPAEDSSPEDFDALWEETASTPAPDLSDAATDSRSEDFNALFEEGASGPDLTPADPPELDEGAPDPDPMLEDFELDFSPNEEAAPSADLPPDTDAMTDTLSDDLDLDDLDLDRPDEEAATSPDQPSLTDDELRPADTDSSQTHSEDSTEAIAPPPETTDDGGSLQDTPAPDVLDLADDVLTEDIWDTPTFLSDSLDGDLNLNGDAGLTQDELAGLDPENADADPMTTGLDLSDLEEGSASAEEVEAFSDPQSEATGDSTFDDLDNLLDTTPRVEETVDTPVADQVIEDEDFDDLEALLQEDEAEAAFNLTAAATDAEPEPPSSHDTDDLDEFGDLEKLLQDTDQLGGSSPSLTGRRASTAPAVRRAPRRNQTVTDQTMRVSVSHLDILSNLVGELVVNRNSLEQDQERLRQFLDNLLGQVQQLNDVGQRMRDLYERSLLESSLISSRQALAIPGPSNGVGNSHATGATFDALEMDRFTGFHTLSQEMIELIVRVREAASDIEFTIDSSDQITRQFRQVTTQLQEGLNKARMVPFGQTADRLPRAVRDISLKCGKEARLVVEGRDTLIDKMILERLYDPVTHLVNNAITHGIEPPEARVAQGKPREGNITIRAFYQGNQTVIHIADDGGGINPEVVKAKAVKRGLITPAEAKDISEVEVYDLLFLPGFSTRDQADDFSGRGVGMDVVRTALTEIRGAITTESTLGQGTSFTIRLPLTLSITKALSCVNNQARIAFPMDGVEDMFDVPRERVQTNEQGVSCILWRDTLLPFRPLSELLKFNRGLGRGRVYGGTGDENVISIVVLRSASTFVGLQVDQVIGEQEIVIKQLEGPVPKPTGIAGATVMGDGRVMPIADVIELIDLAMGRARREPSSTIWGQPEAEEAETQTAAEEPTVLIVDDSITVRELLSMSFNKVGYRVEQARDGQEAWEKLRAGLPCDLVFCDIEMPRMDGLELLSRLQKDEQLAEIPIAMLTSRGADRHRQMAVELGASGYFTKPYLEEMLLDAAQRMLNGENLIGAKAETQPQNA